MPNFMHTKVDPDRLKVTSDNITQSVCRINNAFHVIDTEITALDSFWKGPSSRYYFDRYKKDKEFFSTYMILFTEFNDLLREAAGIFDYAEVKVREQVDQL